MNIRNEDVKGVIVEIPEGHVHLRATIFLQDGTELTFQEATIANLLRAYTAVKTHPKVKKVVLKGRKVNKRKRGYAEWQLLEAEDEDI